MKVALVFDTPYTGYRHEQHVAQMEHEFAEDVEPDMEYQVGEALLANGHDIRYVGVRDDVSDALDDLRTFGPDLVFNCAESFFQMDRLDYLLPAMMEAEGYRYTGAPPLCLMITRNKGMSKKILRHHDVPVPDFVTYRLGEKVKEAPPVPFPLIVKPLMMDASVGIAQASVVHDLDDLAARVAFVHQRIGQAAIAEKFIAGREIYVPVIGNGDDLQILPLVELTFDKSKTKPEERIATKLAKWDEGYRENRGIKSVYARPVSAKARARIEEACRAAYSALWLRDYARFDIRLDDDDEPWLLEANANPYLNDGHEFAKAAEKTGLGYHALIQRIVDVAMSRDLHSSHA